MNGALARCPDRDRLRTAVFSTVLFGLIAHGYCYFNVFYSHDSLLLYQDWENSFQVTLGRFLAPLYRILRGNFYPPLLVGVFSLAFLSAAVYLTVRLLDIRSRALVALCGGILSTCATLTLTNATYIKDADIYMLGLLLAVAAVYAMFRCRRGMAAGTALLCLSLGLYQAMFAAAVFLSMVMVVKAILEGAEVRQTLLTGVKAVLTLLLGLVAYSVVLQLVLRLGGAALSQGYNSLSSVGQFDGLSDVLRQIAGTYRYTVGFFISDQVLYTRPVTVINLLLLGLSLAALGYLAAARKVRGWNLAILAAVVALMPFGINVTYFLSKGVIHHLMLFPFFFVYVFAAMLLDMLRQQVTEGAGPRLRRAEAWVRTAACVLMTVLILQGVVFANQVYLKKDLEYQATLSVATRMLDRIEQLEGYLPGQTPVALVGQLSDSPISASREELGRLKGTGLSGNFSVTYESTYYWYFQRILAYSINLLDQGTCEQWGQREDVAAMSVFPAAGCCRMIEGVAVLKLS